MGYFDAVTSGYFKPASDGRKLFFPYGIFGRGYILESEQVYERLRRKMKTFTVIWLTLMMICIIGTSWLENYYLSFLVIFCFATVVFVFQMVWSRFLVRGLQRSNEKLSLGDTWTAQANAHSAMGLWFMEIIGLAFVGLSILVLILDPRQWLAATGGIILFGLLAAFFARLLVLRRRSARALDGAR